MKPQIKYVGMYPGNAVAQVRYMYNRLPDTHKIKLLLDERALPETIKGEIVKEFQSRQTTDINAGEMLGIGLIGSYFNVTGEPNKRTYQAMVGIEDAAKSFKETHLSDGAIWENETEKKMMFQQTLVQGYYPKPRVADTEDVITVINNKIKRKRRGDYPESSGLIVNIFSANVNIDLNAVTASCDLDEFGSVFCVLYKLPALSQAIVYLLEKGADPETTDGLKMGFNLSEFSEDPDWKINTDKTKW